MPKRRSTEKCESDNVKKIKRYMKKMEKIIKEAEGKPKRSSKNKTYRRIISSSPSPEREDSDTIDMEIEYNKENLEIEYNREIESHREAESHRETESNKETELNKETESDINIESELNKETESAIDAEVLSAMGSVITEQAKGPSVHQEIVNRWTATLTKGINKEEKIELFKKYLPFDNIPKMIPPKLNPELSFAVSQQVKKRDTIIEEKQKQISTALSALGMGLQSLITKGDKIEMLKNINDASKILCDAIFSETKGRRTLILKAVNQNLKESMQGEADTLLFGNDLPERIKTAKAVQKSGRELTIKTQKPNMNPPYKKTLNWRGPPRPSANYRTIGGPGGKNTQTSRTPRKIQTDRKKQPIRNRR